MKVYTEKYEFLIDALRDAANGALPGCFTGMGNALADYVEFLPHCTSDKMREDAFLRMLHSMKQSLEGCIASIEKDGTNPDHW